MLGVALTVKARAGDNLMFHKALNMAGPGDVVVVSNGLDRNRSLMGEIMAIFARNKGISGLVLDGPIRDIDTISTFEMPIYATGTTPGGPYKMGPGEINVNISCGGISVNPGDIILGDDDGIIVIPREDAANILEDAKILKANDLRKVEAAEQNKADRRWIDKLLAERNCEFID
jgi:regulator of RNase E activity RraA